VVTLCGGLREPCPLLEGTVRGTITPADLADANTRTLQGLDTFEEFVRALQERARYADAENFAFRFRSGAEIRGQIFEIDPNAA